jgi:hypothetical protein
MERRYVPGIQPAHGGAGSQGRQAPIEMQGAEALPRIQPADGWEGVKGSGSAPFVVMEPRKVPGIQTAQGWSGSQGRKAPVQGFRDAKSLTHANAVCISAPFGLSVHADDAAMGIRKKEMRSPLYSL